MYFNVNFNVFFKLIKVIFLVSELYIHQNARCNDQKKKNNSCRCLTLQESKFNISLSTKTDLSQWGKVEIYERQASYFLRRSIY